MGQMKVARYDAHSGVNATATVAVKAGDAVKVSGVKSVAPTNDAADIYVGVAQNDAAVGDVVSIRVQGDVMTMTAAAAIAAGTKLVPDLATPGRVKAWTAEGVETIIGIAWTTTTAEGQEIQVITK